MCIKVAALIRARCDVTHVHHRILMTRRTIDNQEPRDGMSHTSRMQNGIAAAAEPVALFKCPAYNVAEQRRIYWRSSSKGRLRLFVESDGSKCCTEIDNLVLQELFIRGIVDELDSCRFVHRMQKLWLETWKLRLLPSTPRPQYIFQSAANAE